MEVIYLVFFFSWYAHPTGIAFDMETLPQASMEQCEENGAALKEVYSEIKWKCIKGIAPLRGDGLGT